MSDKKNMECQDDMAEAGLEHLKNCLQQSIPNNPEAWAQIYGDREELKKFVVLFRNNLLHEREWLLLLSIPDFEHLTLSSETSVNYLTWADQTYLAIVKAEDNTQLKTILQIDHASFMKRYRNQPHLFIRDAHTCLRKELEIFTAQETPVLKQNTGSVSTDLCDISAVIAAKNSLEDCMTQLLEYSKKYENTRTNLRELQIQASQGGPRDQRVNSQLQNQDNNTKDFLNKARNTAENGLRLVKHFLQLCKAQCQILEPELEDYKQTFCQYHINLLATSPNVPFQLQDKYLNIGQSILDASKTNFELLKSFQKTDEMKNDVSQIRKDLLSFWQSIIGSTLVILEQPRFIKKGNIKEGGSKTLESQASSLKIKILALPRDALKSFDMMFFPEQSVSSSVDTTCVAKCTLKNNFVLVTKGTDCIQYNITSKLKKFENSSGEISRDSFRFVFLVKVCNISECIRAFSLPVAVGTASNQRCKQMGMLTWKCSFSTDPYQPKCEKTHVPVDDVVNVLDRRAQVVTDSPLTEPSKEFLKNKLLKLSKNQHATQITPNSEINKNSFFWDNAATCCQKTGSPNEDAKFSFWIWFSGCLTLIENHLLHLWQKGCILGFASKTYCEEMLRNQEPGTCCLRFSESKITQKSSQSPSACVSVVGKCTDGSVCNLEPFETSELKNNGIVNNLKEIRLDNGKGLHHIYPMGVKIADLNDSMEKKRTNNHYHRRLKIQMLDLGNLSLEDVELPGRKIKKSKTTSPIHERKKNSNDTTLDTAMLGSRSQPDMASTTPKTKGHNTSQSLPHCQIFETNPNGYPRGQTPMPKKADSAHPSTVDLFPRNPHEGCQDAMVQFGDQQKLTQQCLKNFLEKKSCSVTAGPQVLPMMETTQGSNLCQPWIGSVPIENAPSDLPFNEISSGCTACHSNDAKLQEAEKEITQANYDINDEYLGENDLVLDQEGSGSYLDWILDSDDVCKDDVNAGCLQNEQEFPTSNDDSKVPGGLLSPSKDPFLSLLPEKPT